MIPNATITGWRKKTGAHPSGGDALTAVEWPAGRLVPCQVEEFGAVKVANLQASGLDMTRGVRVRRAALAALGFSPMVGDRVTLASRAGTDGVEYAVKSVRSPVGERAGANDEAVLLLGRASA